MKKRRRMVSPFRLAVLLVLIGGAVYVNQVVVPQTPPLFLPTPTATRDPASYIAEGQTMFNDGKIAKAIEAYKQAVRANGRDISTYITLSQLELYNHQFKDALNDIGDALLLNPTNSTALAIKGYAQYNLADYPGAETTLKQAIDADPTNALPHAYYAELVATQIQQLNQVRPLGIQEAIDEAHKAIDLGPNIVESHRAYGYVLYVTQNYQQAIEQYQAGIAINQNIADLYTGLGNCYFAKPDTYDQAVEAYLKAIPLNPTDPDPDIYLAKVYNQQGQYPMAIQYAELAVKNDPTNPMRYGSLGVYLRRNKQYDQAVTNLEIAVKGGTSEDGKAVTGVPLSRDPNISLFYAAYGLALAQVNRCTEAAPVAQAILQAMPDDENAVYNANAILDQCKQNLEGTFTPSPEPKSAKGSSTPAP